MIDNPMTFAFIDQDCKKDCNKCVKAWWAMGYDGETVLECHPEHKGGYDKYYISKHGTISGLAN